MICLGFRLAKNKQENMEAKMEAAEDNIVKMRGELKKFIADEEVVARHADKRRLNALKARHAVADAATFQSRYGNLPGLSGNFVNKLLQKKLSVQKNRAEKAETKSREADEVLKQFRESKKTLVDRIANAMGFEPPARISEKEVEEEPAREKLLFETVSKELDDALAALREAAVEGEQKEQELKNLKESIEVKIREEITEKQREPLKKAEEEYLGAVNKEKSLMEVVPKMKALVDEYPAKEKLEFQALSKELGEAGAALKEAVLEREQKEQALKSLKELIESKVKAELAREEKSIEKAKEELTNVMEKEKRPTVVVAKKKMLAEQAALNYKNAVEDIVRRKENESLKPLLSEPPAKGGDKIFLFLKAFFEVIQSKFEEKGIKEIPTYDTSRYGEIVSFAPPGNFEIVEQAWITKPYALVTILYNKQTHNNLYYISDPLLNSFEEALLRRVNDSLKVFLLEQEIDFSSMDKERLLYNNYIKILYIYGIHLDQKSMHKIWYHVKTNYVGYGKLDVFLKDPMIEDISVVGADTPVYLYHRKYTNIETNIVFEEEELNEIIMKLAQISGKSISTGYPIMNARLPDGSRLEATLGREVTTRGGTITIRKFREDPFTPTDLIKSGTFSTEIFAYLWIAVENNKSMIFVGETASGKTTTLNVVSLFIPSESKIVTIEDTRELTLYHKNWIPGVVREAFMGQEVQAIDMFELLRSALRQRPEYIIVGEVRGKEAYTLFQAMSTGHTTYSTLHAGSVQLAVNRLINEPINVPLMMLGALNIMTIQVLRYVGRKRLRRMESLSEFVGIDAATGNISTRELYKWNPVLDRMEQSGSSKVLDDIMNSKGWTREQLKKELDNRELVLKYMVDHDIHDYMDFSYIIQTYASDPERVVSTIKEGKNLPLEAR